MKGVTYGNRNTAGPEQGLNNESRNSQLLRIIMHSNPLIVAEGSSNGVPYVIVSGPDDHFTFTKTDDGYKLTKTK